MYDRRKSPGRLKNRHLPASGNPTETEKHGRRGKNQRGLNVIY